MRKSQIFIGSSHPELGKLISDRLGVEPAPCKIYSFSNGETGCDIGVSVRDTHAIIILGSADLINDRIMELLVLISGCRGGSASKITCVIPMFPYSKQSKMKKHRGAITARMLANLITKAGADHVITMDLHAGQMQGFFSKPVDNLSAGPTLARWIRQNVPDYRNAVVVSKNPGGTKRVTALADALKINFAMIHTDRRRVAARPVAEAFPANEVHVDDDSDSEEINPMASSITTFGEADDDQSAMSSERLGSQNSNIHIARVLGGHVVTDAASAATLPASITPCKDHVAETTVPGLGGSSEANPSDDEEIDYTQEQVIALVGDVKGRAAIILDDMIDRPDSFIAAAEHCRLSCGASAVYIVATHGVFSEGSLEALSDCPFIDHIVVTNTYPNTRASPKLHVIDISGILAECIRRNHNGESISTLFEQLAVI